MNTIPDMSQLKNTLSLISHVREVIYRTRLFAFVVLSIVSTHSAQANPGANPPWTTYNYEAGNLTNGGGATIIGPPEQLSSISATFSDTIAGEASGGQAFELTGTGQYVQLTAQAAANSIVVRYCVPDTANGGGTNYTISLYTNGVFVQELPLTSQYTWLYGTYGSGTPAWNNNPSYGNPRNFFDEVRLNGLTINPGDTVSLQENTDDTATNYVIDLVDLENVAAPLTQPANSLSITSSPYNADPTGVNDSSAALVNCISAAGSSQSVWMPAGTYKISEPINLPSNITIQGAGMWYTTLVGDPTVYDNPADTYTYGSSNRRISFVGNGSNIHLSDFAIIGKLNFRNDSDWNDGIVGQYGTGSAISRLWVEHTKTGAWLTSSSGLVVSDCRFRDTIADGINLQLGMQSTIVTNCTTRGTGDDCFAFWPASTGSYTPGLNVITHCTGQLPFLANGGAIYGGVSNTIEDCVFSDIPYGCGILIAGTFAVGTNVFSGTTVAQRCNLTRCGGYDPNGWNWRAAVTIVPQSQNITNLNINNLNITNSLSYGVEVIYSSPGVVSNATMNVVNISNYGVGVSNGVYGVWSGYYDNYAVGSLNVSGLTVNGVPITSMPASGTAVVNQSPDFTFNFTNTISVPVQAMAFVQQPGNVLQGATITPEVQVQAFDTNGQALAGATITLSLGSGTGTLAGTLTRSTDAGGIAHFNDLSVNQAGPKTLTATAASGSAPPTNSSSFMVIGSVAALAFATQPGSAVAGVSFGQQPVLKTVDAFGSPTTTGLPASAIVNVALTNGNGTLLGTTNYNIGTGGSNGVVTFNNLAIDTAGSGDQLVASTTIPTGNPVSGMSIWLDGSVASSVLTNASGIVTNWLDQSGNGNNFGTTIGSGGNGICYTNTAANGRRTVTFNATSGSTGTELKNTTYTNTAKTISVFVVARKTVAGTAEDGYQHVFATWAGGANPDYADDGSYSLDYNQNNNTPRIIRGCCSAYVDNNCPVIDPSTNYHAFEYVADGAGSNGIWLATSGGTTQGTGPLFGNVSAYFNIVASTVGGGMQNGTTVNNPFAGSIAEVLVYNSALRAADRTSVENYLRNKWFAPNGGSSISNAVSAPFTVSPAGSPTRQNILGVLISGNASVTLTYATTPGFPYHVETTTNLLPASWTTLAGSATNANGATLIFTDPNPLGGGQRYYRTVSP
jgi:hypothetical protein